MHIRMTVSNWIQNLSKNYLNCNLLFKSCNIRVYVKLYDIIFVGSGSYDGSI